MNQTIRDKAGNIIDYAGAATTVVNTASIEAAKFPSCTAVRIIPLLGTSLGVAVDIIVGQEGFEQAVLSQVYATITAAKVTGVAITGILAAGGTLNAPVLLGIGCLAWGTYWIVDTTIDYLTQ